MPSYKLRSNNYSSDDDEKRVPYAAGTSFNQFLTNQLNTFRLSEQEQADKFVQVIGGGIQTGFTEAREILDGLGVLEGDIETNIDKTYSIIQEELAAFRDLYQAPPLA